MAKVLFPAIFGVIFTFSSSGLASYDLEFDAQQNKVELVGPYIKFNFLTPPFSFGQYPFKKSDLRFELTETVQGPSALTAVWPQYFLSFGSISVFDYKNNKIFSMKFTKESLNSQKGLATLPLPMNLQEFQEDFAKGIHFCVEDKIPTTEIQVCSDKMALTGKNFSPLKDSVDVKVLMNDQKVPTNAQINLNPDDKEVELLVKFRSGLKIKIKDQVDKITIGQISLNIKEKRIGISGRRERFHKSKLSFPQKIKNYLREKNYYLDAFNTAVEAPQEITDVEMEFAPFKEAASMQIYGLSFNEIPSKEFDLKLDKSAPISTYKDKVVLKGYKSPEENVYGTSPGSLRVSKDKKKFLWTFKTPEKGQMNTDQMVYSRGDGEKFYFTRRVYRGHQASISASAALGSSLDLSIVPGYQINTDYWPETLWNRHPLIYQRWGFAFAKVQTFSKFKIKAAAEKWGTDWINFDIMARLNPGVRPVESSFGFGFRYLVPSFSREISSTLSPHLIGLGAFWHTAPQKIVDDIFSTVPFFRYPKWMEISLYFYPLTLSSGFSLGLAFSYSARGRMYFAQNWFFDASINVNSIQFAKARDVKVNIATAQGTLGIGYNF